MAEVTAKCPHCGFKNTHELCHPFDGEGYTDCECNACGKYYQFTLSIFTDFTALDIEKEIDDDNK